MAVSSFELMAPVMKELYEEAKRVSWANGAIDIEAQVVKEPVALLEGGE